MLLHLRNALLAATGTFLLIVATSPNTACFAHAFNDHPRAVLIETATAALSQALHTIRTLQTGGIQALLT